MSTKKKLTQPKTEDKPKYRLGQKVFFADYTNLRPRLFDGKVLSINSITIPPSDLDTHKEHTDICYSIQTVKGIFDVWQWRVFPSLQSAAIEHGKTIFEAL